MQIEDRHLDAVRKIFAERVPDCEVRAFGSRVRGTARKHSDLDIAIVARDGKKLDWRVVPSLINDFQESRIPFRVDVTDYHSISENFREIIDRQYEIIFKKGE